jgi:hypothetical protein
MTTDPIPFLANIIAVSYANGSLSPGELSQIEAIRVELNFKKADYTKATKLIEQGGYQMSPVGSFADQVKNLECILRVAYADDELEQTESDLIAAFCHQIGIYQDQLDRLEAEVIAFISSIGKLCHSCGGQVPGEAKFCAKCGTPVTEAQNSLQVTFEIPQSGLVIEFAESTAASFHKALEAAKTSDQYQTCQRMKKDWHMAVFTSGSVGQALPLAAALSGVRNRRAYLNGVEVSWDELFGFAWCANQRATAYRPIEFCFGKDENRINPWGCKQTGLDWVEWSDWFSFGKWEKGGLLGPRFVWRFDKERIKHELATRLFRFRHCPHLDTRLPEAVLRLLPECVSPEQGKDWKYNQNFEQVPGAIKVVIREGSGQLAYDNEFWSDGVRPVGHRVLTQILTQAFQELNITHISPAALLK